jgi:hypothetical protein
VGSAPGRRSLGSVGIERQALLLGEALFSFHDSRGGG